VTKPGQSQTVNIARTISAVSSAALFLPGILVRPEPRAGQTIRVASEPADVVNSFRPPDALGSPVDRVLQNATDPFFKPGAIKQILSAGWGTITGHEDTEKIPNCPSKPRIGMRKGRGTIPLEKSYCTGDDNPTDMFRLSEPTLCHIADSFATRVARTMATRGFEKTKEVGFTGHEKENSMEFNTRRKFFGRIAALTAFISAVPKLFAQQTPTNTPSPGGASQNAPGGEAARRPGASHTHNGIYYFSGIGSNDGYPKDDHVLVTDPFEKHVTRTMDALKRSVEHPGSNMDSIIHLDVFLCLPLAETIPTPTGKARFDAHKAQYDALNKIYGTYFSPGRAPSRACVAVEWIPGDSLIEIVGSALVVGPPTPSADK